MRPRGHGKGLAGLPNRSERDIVGHIGWGDAPPSSSKGSGTVKATVHHSQTATSLLRRGELQHFSVATVGSMACLAGCFGASPVVPAPRASGRRRCTPPKAAGSEPAYKSKAAFWIKSSSSPLALRIRWGQPGGSFLRNLGEDNVPRRTLTQLHEERRRDRLRFHQSVLHHAPWDDGPHGAVEVPPGLAPQEFYRRIAQSPMENRPSRKRSVTPPARRERDDRSRPTRRCCSARNRSSVEFGAGVIGGSSVSPSASEQRRRTGRRNISVGDELWGLFEGGMGTRTPPVSEVEPQS